MPASKVEPLVLEDPAIIWLKYHGEQHGLQPDTSPYEFLDFVSEKAQQFEDKWLEEVAPDAVRVCTHAYEARSVDRVRETFELMRRGTPVLAQPALWWAPERIYGVPDVLVHTSWLADHLPKLISGLDLQTTTPNLTPTGKDGHYVVLDIKFTTGLHTAHKAKDLRCYAAQIRIYSYMLGHLQGIMPQRGYLITRDRIFDPVPIDITSSLNQPLDKDLATHRDQFVEIKTNGAKYVPWRDSIVASDISHRDPQWYTAKKIIAREKMPGRDPGIVYQIGTATKRDLARCGFPTLDSMLSVEPGAIPLERCSRLGPTTSQRIRAILAANRSGLPVIPYSSSVPARKEFEFYVDFEYLSNINVDFERQWPTLDGCEQIFMVGVGWCRQGDWSFRTFIAAAEGQDREREMLENFTEFLKDQTDGAFVDRARTSLFHWTSAEVWQCQRASDRHGFSDSHPLRSLPWSDLHKEFLHAPTGLPGAWSYQLKDVSRALMRLRPDLGLQWPGDLDQGLRAMVMGWRAYQTAEPLASEEMKLLARYLEADCRALWCILKWMRDGYLISKE
jgi:uncharacterized protein